MTENVKLKKFVELAELLNKSLNIVPLLYGSLGLEVVSGADFNSDDIDILIPKEYIFDGWNLLLSLLENNGYRLIDMHEHTFIKDGYEFSFSFIESLEEHFKLKISDILSVDTDKARYRLLSLEQYLAVYEKFACDEYRISHGKSENDLKKVNYLKERLKQQK